MDFGNASEREKLWIREIHRMQAIVAVQQPTAEAAGLPPSPGNPLSALADVAANLFISLPDSPQGKPFIDRAEAGSPAALLRAMRKVSAARTPWSKTAREGGSVRRIRPTCHTGTCRMHRLCLHAVGTPVCHQQAAASLPRAESAPRAL